MSDQFGKPDCWFSHAKAQLLIIKHGKKPCLSILKANIWIHFHLNGTKPKFLKASKQLSVLIIYQSTNQNCEDQTLEDLAKSQNSLVKWGFQIFLKSLM